MNNFAKIELNTHYKYKRTAKSPCVSPQNGVNNFKKFVKVKSFVLLFLFIYALYKILF